MSTTHVEALDIDQSVDLFEQATQTGAVDVPVAVQAILPGLEHCQVVQVPATEAADPVTDARAVMVLGAAREVTCSDVGDGQLLVPGDVLVPGPGAAVTVGASDDDQDLALLLVLS